MKVFDWVHRRFPKVNSCTAFLEENEMKKNVTLKVETEMHVLHEDNAHMVVDDMVDFLKNGILSIGTLAIGPLEAHKFGEVDEEVDYDHDESIPLINVEFFSHDLEKVIGANHEIIEEEIIDNHVINLKDNTSDVNTIEGEIQKRVTLGDLFLEDYPPIKMFAKLEEDYSGDEIIKDYLIKEKQEGVEMIIKQTSHTKHGLSKAKKVFKDDLFSLKKFNQLMKRMMKSKVHPELDGKSYKDIQMHPTLVPSDPTIDLNASNIELASMVFIQDDMA